MDEMGVVLISGANKGLGFEAARQMGKMGYKVLLGSRDVAKGKAAAEILRKEGLDVVAVKLDVNSKADIDAVARLINVDYGGVLDVLVNNAGLMVEKSWTNNITSEMKADDIRATYETNVVAPFVLTKALLPALKHSKAGRIVNVSSILGSVTLQA